ncbi:hypothetical protein SprV_0602163300 [Sparganum proliferum]
MNSTPEEVVELETAFDVNPRIGHLFSQEWTHTVSLASRRKDWSPERTPSHNETAIRRRDALSLVFARALEYDHRFNRDDTEVIAMANTKQAKEFLEAWYSNAGSINRHVDLDAHYEGLRSRLAAPSPNHASTTANAVARSPDDSPPTLLLLLKHSVP